MAALTAAQLGEMGSAVSKEIVDVDYTKAEIHAALQAIEDWYDANKASGSTAIDTATAPYVFTNPQKKKLFRYWLLLKSKREA